MIWIWLMPSRAGEAFSLGLMLIDYLDGQVCVQSYPTLCRPVDCSPPSSSVHGILQARILEWTDIPSSPEDLPDPGIKPTSSVAPVLQADSLPLTHRGSPKDLLYSTGNSTLYSLMAYMGKESKR